MFKNLSVEALGISGRQSELIELALTYKFRGLELDLPQFMKQVKARGLDQARRLMDSAKLKVGSFDLPVRWQGSDAEFQEDLAALAEWAPVAASIGAVRTRTVIEPGSDERPYHENFEFHRKRLTELGDLLAPHGIQLGIDLLAPAEFRADKRFQFIQQVDAMLMLLSTIGLPSVGLALDLWSWYAGGGTMTQLQSLSPETVISVRAADAPEGVPPASLTDEQRLLPGQTGVVPCEEALAILAQAGYDGPVTPHAHSSTLTNVTRDSIVQQASKALDELFAGAGAGKGPAMSKAGQN